MDKCQAIELAEATSHWLAFKCLSGFENLLGEALLITPVAEYLLGHGWNIEIERDYNATFPSVKPAHIYYDLVGRRGQDHFVLEMKFFKDSGHPRVFADIMRLALPSESNWPRFLLLAWRIKPFDKGPIKNFFNLDRDKAIELSMLGNALAVSGERLKLPIEVANSVGNLKNYGHLPGTVTVTCLARHPAGAHRVSVLRIDRSYE
jgi:hypothetical protein